MAESNDKNQIEEAESKGLTGNQDVFLRLPYALAKQRGINTDGLTPRQVWQKLKGVGVNPQQEMEKTAAALSGKKRERLKDVYEQNEEFQQNQGLTKEAEGSIIKEGKTPQESAQIAVSEGLSRQADYRGMSAEAANEFNATLAQRKGEYPSMGELAFIGNAKARNKLIKARVEQHVRDELLRSYPALANNPARLADEIKRNVDRNMRKLAVSKNQIAIFFAGEQVGFRGICVNTDNIGNIDALTRGVDSGFHPIGTNSIKAVIDHEVGHAISDTLGLKKNVRLSQLYYKGLSDGSIRTGLSRYAATGGYEEFIAEAFSEYKNNPNPRPLAREVGKIIDEENAKWTNTNLKK